MQTDGDVQVAILSSRPSLDLAINTWVPGYLARSSTDIDVVMDLTQDGGVVVIDLLHGDAPELIRSLRERGVDAPIVVLASTSQRYEPPVNGDVVVANSADIGELSAAFEAAQAQHRSRRVLEGRADAMGTGSGDRPPGESNGDGDSLASYVEEAAPDTPPPTVIDLRDTPDDDEDTRPGLFVAREEPGGQPRARRQDRIGTGSRRRGLRFGRRSRRAQDLLRDSVTDTGRAAETGTTPVPEGSPGSRPVDDRREVNAVEGEGEAGAAEAGTLEGEAAEAIDLNDALLLPAAGGEDVAASVEVPVASVPESAPAAASEPEQPSVVEASPVTASLVDAWSAARAWVVLDELETLIGSGSAVVAVPTSENSYGIVAGVGIAPVEARRSIPTGHPVVTELRRPGGWFIRVAGAAVSRGPLLPLAECVHLLALAVPSTDGRPEAIVIIGRHEPFDVDEAAGAAAIVQDHRHLDARLRRIQSPGTAFAPAAEPHTAARQVVLAGWQVLDDLFPALDGAAAAVAFRDRDLFAVSAAVRVDASQAGRVLGADHALLTAMRGEAAGQIVRAASDDRALLSGLPLPRAAFVAAMPLGDVGRPHGVVLLSHHRRIEQTELGGWHATLAAHPVQALEG